MTELEKAMAALKEGIKVKKTTASLAYFQERLEELVAMGSELLIEGREVSQHKCKERVLALFKAKFPEIVSSQIDPDLCPAEDLESSTLFADPLYDPNRHSDEPTNEPVP